MNQILLRAGLAATLLSTLALASCRNDAPAPVVPAASPEASPTATPSVAPSPSPSPAAVGFRDDFDGAQLDDTRWLSFPQSGIIRLTGGKLELLNTAGQKDFPYLVTRDEIVPPTGPFFVEFSYTYLTLGAPVAFCLDYLPAAQPNEKPLTTPFMATAGFYGNLVLNFDTENGTQSFQGVRALSVGVAHRVRLECDGQQNYRAIIDQTEVGTFASKRRPTKFWIGTNPPKDQPTGQTWPRLDVDYVAAGPLASPDAATPAPSPTPSASPSAH